MPLRLTTTIIPFNEICYSEKVFVGSFNCRWRRNNPAFSQGQSPINDTRLLLKELSGISFFIIFLQEWEARGSADDWRDDCTIKESTFTYTVQEGYIPPMRISLKWSPLKERISKANCFSSNWMRTVKGNTGEMIFNTCYSVYLFIFH